MAYPVYYVPAGDVLPIFFDSFDGGTGASAATTGLAVTDIEIYKDGSVTQRASDAGYTLLDTDGLDFDGLTGINGFSVDTGDNTDAGFYTVGAWFHVVVSAVTIDAQTVNFIAAAFRLMAAEGVAGVPDVNTTHISDTAQTGNDVGADVNDILVDTAVIGAAGAGLTALATQTSVDTIDNFVDDLESRLTAQRAGYLDNLSAGAAALETTAQSILTDTAEIGAAGAGLTNINLPNQTMDIVGNVTGNLSGSVGSVTGAVGSVTAGVTVTTNNDKTGYGLSSAALDGILRTALTEAYSADGAAPTLSQAIFIIMQRLLDFAITGTAISVKKLDGTTEAYTLLLDDDTNPTSSARNG